MRVSEKLSDSSEVTQPASGRPTYFTVPRGLGQEVAPRLSGFYVGDVWWLRLGTGRGPELAYASSVASDSGGPSQVY